MSGVVLVRHGRTSWNRSRFLGRRDVPLDDVGREQAAAAAQRLAALVGDGPVVVWSSPLARSRDTAAAVADRLGVPVHLHDGLVELDCGEWEGREKADVGRKVSLLAADEAVPGGESATDVWRRLDRFCADAGLPRAAVGSDDPTVVVVAHHLVNKLLWAALRGHDVDGALRTAEYRPAPGSVQPLPAADLRPLRPAPAPLRPVGPVAG